MNASPPPPIDGLVAEAINLIAKFSVEAKIIQWDCSGDMVRIVYCPHWSDSVVCCRLLLRIFA